MSDKMKEYIEKDAVLNLMNDLRNYKSLDFADAIEIVEKQPAADVAEVRHGRWLPDYDYTEYDFDGSTPLPEPRKFQDGWQCSLCGQYEPSETKYCPHCGAKMDGGVNDG